LSVGAGMWKFILSDALGRGCAAQRETGEARIAAQLETQKSKFLWQWAEGAQFPEEVCDEAWEKMEGPFRKKMTTRLEEELATFRESLKGAADHVMDPAGNRPVEEQPNPFVLRTNPAGSRKRPRQESGDGSGGVQVSGEEQEDRTESSDGESSGKDAPSKSDKSGGESDDGDSAYDSEDAKEE